MAWLEVDSLPVPLPYSVTIRRPENSLTSICCKWPPMPEEEGDFLYRAAGTGRVYLAYCGDNGTTFSGWVRAVEYQEPYLFHHMNRRWMGSVSMVFLEIRRTE